MGVGLVLFLCVRRKRRERCGNTGADRGLLLLPYLESKERNAVAFIPLFGLEVEFVSHFYYMDVVVVIIIGPVLEEVGQ